MTTFDATLEQRLLEMRIKLLESLLYSCWEEYSLLLSRCEDDDYRLLKSFREWYQASEKLHAARDQLLKIRLGQTGEKNESQ